MQKPFLMIDIENRRQDQQISQDIKPNHVLHDSQTEQANKTTETTIADSGSASISSNENGKVCREDIELVQKLIERCLQLYMNRDEVVKILLNRFKIDPGFTTLVWQKLEEENADFFRSYYIRLKLKKQIILFNHLLEQQYHLMKYPLHPNVPMQNGTHPMPVNNLPIGYPIVQHPPLPAMGQPHIDAMGYSMSNSHVVNGVPAPGNFHLMHRISGNNMLMGTTTADVPPIMKPNNAVSSTSDMPVSPTSVASSCHFPFNASEISGMGPDTSALDAAFASDVASSAGVQLPPDNAAGDSRDTLRYLAQIPWNFSLSDLTADLSSMGDLGGIRNSPFLPPDSDILLDSPEQENIEEFFVDSDSVPEQHPPLDEEKP